MNGKYIFYALCITLVSTVMSWSNMIKSSANSGSGSGFSSTSSGGGGSFGNGSGGGHK